MSQPEKIGILYGQIISQVIADAKQRFEEEGVDMAVLSELEKVSCMRASQCGAPRRGVRKRHAGARVYPHVCVGALVWNTWRRWAQGHSRLVSV